MDLDATDESLKRLNSSLALNTFSRKANKNQLQVFHWFTTTTSRVCIFSFTHTVVEVRFRCPEYGPGSQGLQFEWEAVWFWNLLTLFSMVWIDHDDGMVKQRIVHGMGFMDHSMVWMDFTAMLRHCCLKTVWVEAALLQIKLKPAYPAQHAPPRDARAARHPTKWGSAAVAAAAAVAGCPYEGVTLRVVPQPLLFRIFNSPAGDPRSRLGLDPRPGEMPRPAARTGYARSRLI